MIELFRFALNNIDVGIILIDINQKIIFWNKYIERISRVRHEEAEGKKLEDVCPTFKKNRYQEIIDTVLIQNQSRFCSSKLHKAFVFPKSGNISKIRQNMKIEPISIGNNIYGLIQIDDITYEVTNESSLTSLINELKKGYIEVKESEEFNRQLAEMDPLTKIANRHAISQYIDNLFKSKQSLTGYALMFIDLDGFKSVNDTYGHLMGDNLLVRVAGILKGKVRKDDVVARLGGDEFLIMLSSIETSQAAEFVGKKLVNEISKPIEIDGKTVNVTASIGIALYDESIKSTRDFIKVADASMYKAKREGKNKYVVYKKD